MTDDELSALYSREATEIMKARGEALQRFYLQVRDAYQTPYQWPNLDPLRHEVALCITFGLHQAAINLTNHLLESLLKEALITHHSLPVLRKSGGDVVNSFIEGTEEARSKYGGANLGKTLSAAKRVGLITKDQWKELDEFRKHVRNPYSHADRAAMLRDTTVPMQPVRLSDGAFELGESREVRAAKMPIGQGLILAMIAERQSVPYFLHVDGLARELWPKVFPNAGRRRGDTGAEESSPPS